MMIGFQVFCFKFSHFLSNVYTSNACFFFCYSFPVVCKDQYFCQDYSTTMCQTWPNYMKEYCPKMCGHCGCRYTIIVIHLGCVISCIIYMDQRVLYVSSEEMLIWRRNVFVPFGPAISKHACFSNKPVFCEKIKKKTGLIYVISSSDFQTFSTVLIFFVLDSRFLDEFEKKNRWYHKSE